MLRPVIFAVVMSFVFKPSTAQNSKLGEAGRMLNEFLDNPGVFNNDFMDWDVKGDPWASGQWFWSATKAFNVLKTQHHFEKGRRTTIFIVDDKLNLKLIVREVIEYTAKWNDPNVKISKQYKEYYLFDGPEFKRYNETFEEVGDGATNENLKNTFQQQFAGFANKNQLKT